ncbi:hypothetical protein PR048_019419 [Dryococelus australis]|uniref:Uncharacterized protein n=1 Tax=Dryococelus australis TaxID=614101 RepID=A0ABQ9H3F6_9NEOP|nr:hypothetical protein PR048_019419 [Dryococelus australis]
MRGRVKREIPDETRLPAASSEQDSHVWKSGSDPAGVLHAALCTAYRSDGLPLSHTQASPQWQVSVSFMVAYVQALAACRATAVRLSVMQLYVHADLVYTVKRHGGNTARLARRSDEALEVRKSAARIALPLLDLGRADNIPPGTRLGSLIAAANPTKGNNVDGDELTAELIPRDGHARMRRRNRGLQRRRRRGSNLVGSRVPVPART